MVHLPDPAARRGPRHDRAPLRPPLRAASAAAHAREGGGVTASATGRRLLDTVVAHPATVVEASAGTGKTYQLEHLVFDLVAEDRARLEEILVVTFTERATHELVTRIRRTI